MLMTTDAALAWLEDFDRVQTRMASGLTARQAGPESVVARQIRHAMQAPVAAPGLSAPPGRQSGMPSLIESVNTSALIIGTGAASALAADQRVVQASASADETLAELFEKSPLTGCTSIMDIALVRSGWMPHNPRESGNQAAFLRYVQLLADSHFFRLPPQYTQTPLALSAFHSPGALIDGVAALLPHARLEDRKRVSQSLLDMTHSVFQNGGDHSRAQATMFVQQALAVNGSTIDVHLYWCEAAMAYDRTTRKSSVSESIQKHFGVRRYDFAFLPATWSRHAREIARRRITDAGNWLRASSTRDKTF